MISNKVSSHVDEINKVHTEVARAILPVYRTTPSDAHFREADIFPVKLALDNSSGRAVICTRRLDS